MKLFWYTLILLGLLVVSIAVRAQDDGGIIASDDPVPAPEPTPPQMLTFEQVVGYQNLWVQKQEEYLTQNGWTRGTDTPGKFVYWQVTYKGIDYRLEADQAIYVQRGITEENEQAALERSIQQSIGVQ